MSSQTLAGKFVVLQSGARFGLWTLVGQGEWKVYVDKKGGKHRSAGWRVVCDCGTRRQVDGRSLRSGNSKSCGCVQRENARRVFIEYTRTMAALGRGIKDAAGRYQKVPSTAICDAVTEVICDGSAGKPMVTDRSAL